MRYFRSWIIVFAMMAVPALGQRYAFLKVPGSPQRVTALMQGSHSAVWVGASDDAFLFDGKRFYPLRQYGLPKENVVGFGEDGDGGVWIATATMDTQNGSPTGGLYRYQNGKVERMFERAAISVVGAGPDTMLAVISGKTTFDLGDLYAFRRSNGAWKGTLVAKDDAQVLSVDQNGTVLYHCGNVNAWCEVTREQIGQWPAQALQPIRHPLPSGLDISMAYRDRNNCIWIRGLISVWYQCPGEPDTFYHEIQTLNGPQGAVSTSTFSETADGSMLMTGAGLVLARATELFASKADGLRFVRASNGLPTDVGVGIQLRDGTILVGGVSGLYRFMYPFQLEFWKKEDGVDSPYSILRMGGMVFASNNGIQALDATRSKWIPWVEKSRIGGAAVHLMPGPSGTIYAASIEGGVTQHASDGAVVARTKPGQGAARLATDGDGHTWVAGDGIRQVTRQGSSLQWVSEGMDSAGESSLDMEYDAKRDALWACKGGQVVERHSGLWRRVTQRDGLLDDACFGTTVVPNGDVWVGYSTRASMSRIRQDGSGKLSIATIPYQRKQSNGTYGFLRADARGWLWTASEGDDAIALPDAAAQGNWLHLGEEDGLAEPGGNQNSLYPDKDGSVWFGSGDTITHFSPPGDFVTNFPAPELFVAGISVGLAQPLLADSLPRIQYGQPLTAHIGSTQFERRSALRLRYRILPGHSEWKETDSFDVAMGNLLPGSYTVQVQGRMLTGTWSGVQSDSFKVLWPIWLTWPALLLYATSGSSLAFAGNRWKSMQRARRNLSLPDLSEWRKEAMSPETEHLIGTVVDGKYEIGHILSVGGFATVARGRNVTKNGELCAVKIFRFELGDQGWIRYRFKQEVMALEQLSHPNIVKITDHGIVDTGAPYLVMEFIQGSSLRELLEQGALPRVQIARFLRQIASALAVLHHISIYHRDLKPENLMVRHDADGDEQFVLIDFSIAIVKSPDESFHGISRVAGTLGYMAPEQVTGYADSSTDIHSLAKVVLEMLTGLRCADLFPEATLDLPDHVRMHFARNLGVFAPDAVLMIASALAFDPVQRPHDVQEFAAPIIHDLERGP